MYEEGKNLHFIDDSKKRAMKTKKLIIILVSIMIAVPTVICIALMIKVGVLKSDAKELIDVKNEVDNGTYNNASSGGMMADSDTTEENTTSTETTPQENTSEEATSQDTTVPSTTETPSSEEQTTEPPVIQQPTISNPLPSDGKYAYLTFDDGPSVNTMEILDILDRYNVKATFFVNGHTGEEMEARYKAIVDRGHAIGIHTYSHDYKNVYGGLDKFEREVVSLREYIRQVTGADTTLFRFPGGSSNSRTDDIQPYIRWLVQNGYTYWDWNSSSGDAAGKKATAAEIVNNSLIQAKQGYKNLMILMHDTKPKDTTVEALPTLIEQLQAMGYEIRAIDERTAPVQHRKLK